MNTKKTAVEEFVVCDKHDEPIVRVVDQAGAVCPVCNTKMVSIGWIQHKEEDA